MAVRAEMPHDATFPMDRRGGIPIFFRPVRRNFVMRDESELS